MMKLTNNQPFHKSLYTPHDETYTSAWADQFGWKGCVYIFLEDMVVVIFCKDGPD